MAQRDQSIVGSGTVGFDIDEMPWLLEGFEIERDFIGRTIASAITGLGWERLDYEPRRDWILDRLEQFQLMITNFDKQYINEIHYKEWSQIDENDYNPTIPVGYPKCNVHQIYLSVMVVSYVITEINFN